MRFAPALLVLTGFALAATANASLAGAQRAGEAKSTTPAGTPPPPAGQQAQPPSARAEPIVNQAKPRPGETPAQFRTRVQQIYKQALANRVRQQLGLNAAQMTKLMSVDGRYEKQLRQLDLDYRNTVLQERQALQSPNPDSPENQKLLTGLDARVRQIHGHWDDIDSTEQNDLATFMTAAQRIRFNTIKANLQRQIKANSGLSVMPEAPPVAGPMRRGGGAVKPDTGRVPQAGGLR